MNNQKKYKLIALKLFSLPKKDKQWVLESLPKEQAEKITAELQALAELGLENSSSLLSQLESEFLEAQAKDEYTDLIKSFVDMAKTDQQLIYNSVDNETRNILLSGAKQTAPWLSKLENQHGQSELGGRFAKEYLSQLRQEL